MNNKVKRYFIVDGDIVHDTLNRVLRMAGQRKTCVEEAQVIARFAPILRSSTEECDVVTNAGWCPVWGGAVCTAAPARMTCNILCIGVGVARRSPAKRLIRGRGGIVDVCEVCEVCEVCGYPRVWSQNRQKVWCSVYGTHRKVPHPVVGVVAEATWPTAATSIPEWLTVAAEK